MRIINLKESKPRDERLHMNIRSQEALEVWPVDVLLIPEERMALVRHNESCSVHRVELLDTCGARNLKLDTRLLDSTQRSPFAFGTANTLGMMNRMNRPQPCLGSQNILRAYGITPAAKRAASMRPGNLQALNCLAFARI